MSDPDLQLVETMIQRIINRQEQVLGIMLEIRERVGMLEGGWASVSRRLDYLSGEVEMIKRRISPPE